MEQNLQTRLNSDEAARIQALNHLYDFWAPTPGQLEIGRAIARGCRVIFVRVGRNGGKSFGSAGFSARFMLENPGCFVLYTAPLLKQAKEIMWQPELLQQFVPEEYVAHIDNQDYRITFSNGSYFKIDGSENYNAHRGLKPHLVIADEYADFDYRWGEAMFPNLLAKKAVLLCLGTPPEFPVLESGVKHHYVVMDDECQRRAKLSPERVAWIHLPTSSNPTIDPLDLEDEHQRLIARGEEYVYRREYLAEIVSGSSSAIFPMFSSNEHRTDSEALIAMVQKDPSRYDLWVGADPATKSVFRVVFMAIDHYTSTPYWLSELTEKDPSYTVASRMNPRVYETIERIYPVMDEWRFIADNAAASYIEESFQEANFPINWEPTQKKVEDKLDGISLLKEIFLARKRIMGSECEDTTIEFTNYQNDKTGRPIKKGDHSIDISRYILKASGFKMKETPMPKKVIADPEETNYLVAATHQWRKRVLQTDWVGQILTRYS